MASLHLTSFSLGIHLRSYSRRLLFIELNDAANFDLLYVNALSECFMCMLYVNALSENDLYEAGGQVYSSLMCRI